MTRIEWTNNAGEVKHIDTLENPPTDTWLDVRRVQLETQWWEDLYEEINEDD